MKEKLKKYKFWIFILIIFIVKMILVSCQQPYCIYLAGNDDGFVVIMARNLLDFKWLGRYGSTTLSKGIFASAFMALANVLGIPFLTAEHLFYTGACLALVLVLRKKLIKNDCISIILFAILMFNPVLYSIALTRAYRDYLNSSLLLYLIASLFGVFFNYKEKWTKLIIPMVGIGFSYTFMHICREEAMWVLPVVLVSVIMTVLFVLLDKECKEKFKKLILYVIPISIFIIVVGTICTLNYLVYGLFKMNQYSGKTWNDFMEAISSVKVEKQYENVPVSKEAREKIYKVSPAFAELKEYFEGEVGDNWAANGQIPDEIEEAWFSWALIQIMELAGKYTNAKDVNNYFKQVTSEINNAYEDGRLEKLEKTSDFFTKEHFAELFNNFDKTHKFQTTLKWIELRNRVDDMEFDGEPIPTPVLDMWQEVLGENSTNALTYNYFTDKVKIKSLEFILEIYKFLSPKLFNVALVTYFLGFVLLFIKKTRFKNYKEMTFLTGILGLYIIRLFVIAYVETDMFKGAIGSMYLSPTYGLQYIFEFLSIWFFIHSIYELFKHKTETKKVS